MNLIAFSQMESITAFFPCYNDARSIGSIVQKAVKTLKKITPNFEVIVIDDGSSDNSREVLVNLKRRYSELKLIFHPSNRGYGGALISGFKNATKDLIFYTDGDGQYDVEELANLVILMKKDVDFVNGIKITRRDPLIRVVGGNLYNFVIRWFFWLPVFDIDCDFRLIRRRIIKKINLRSTSGAICVELVKKCQKAGARFFQVSVRHHERLHGRSQFFRLNRLIHTSYELILLRIELWIL